MKTLKLLFVASLALASSLAARAGISAPGWLETYYLNPQPDELASAVASLSRSGYFERPGNTAVAIGFISTVFAQHPERVDSWLREFQALPAAHQRLIASALWFSGNPRGGEALRDASDSSPVRAEVLRLSNGPAMTTSDTPVRSASSLNLRWGAFLASGDTAHIVSILEALGSERPGLSTTAQRALALQAVQHPRVLEICRAELEREPEEIRAPLRAALNAAAPAPRS